VVRKTLSDFDSLWDYTNPAGTEREFLKILKQMSQENPAYPELLTQIARAQGLQHKYNEAHITLDKVEKRLDTKPSRVKVRYLLERGRVFNSSGKADLALPLFEQAEEMATQLAEDFLAVDAVHMLAILAPPDQSLTLNLRAIKMADSSKQENANNWLGSLYNNTGWSYHKLGDYESALKTFQKAEAWQRSKGRVDELRIAQWTMGRTLRSMKKYEEALSRQMDLEKELEVAGEEDGYVFEEIGECLLVLDRTLEAGEYFAKAYLTLSQDQGLIERESGRLKRLKQLGRVK
jgi:tetratricopeptide (TPR) repeat protein